MTTLARGVVPTIAPRSAVASAPRAPRAASPGRRRLILHATQIGIVIALLAAWEIGAQTGVISRFLFASPSMIWQVLSTRIASGELFIDIGVTMTEVLAGFVIGAIGGSFLGLLLWYSKWIADLTAPFIAAIGAIPVLAIAPMTIIWFGTEITSKIVIVAFSCIVVSLTQSYRGAQRTDPDLLNLMRSFGASRTQTFLKLVVPSAMPWVVAGLKLNVGFAIVGAIVGEYITSNAGVGNMILLGSSNFSVNIVLAGVAVVMVLVLLLTLAVSALERLVLKWERS